ncbi:MAG: hypothetical protein IKB97_02480 [Bacteroidaceae bacterium]|nr:hypothetical protein [Bacteroidaceae bacterium]
MTEEQYTEAIAIHSRLEALQEVKRCIKIKEEHRLYYCYKLSQNEYETCSEWTLRPIADLLDRHDAMIREEIDREIEELTERIKQI